MQVAEALPLNDASVDAVIGTLVLCSVKDVDQALQGILFLACSVFQSPYRIFCIKFHCGNYVDFTRCCNHC